MKYPAQGATGLFPMTEMRQEGGLPAGVAPIPRLPGVITKKIKIA
jgi:hypothetical protein